MQGPWLGELVKPRRQRLRESSGKVAGGAAHQGLGFSVGYRV